MIERRALGWRSSTPGSHGQAGPGWQPWRGVGQRPTCLGPPTHVSAAPPLVFTGSYTDDFGGERFFSLLLSFPGGGASAGMEFRHCDKRG
eukprot:931090-Prymnesium_polylepis.1